MSHRQRPNSIHVLLVLAFSWQALMFCSSAEGSDATAGALARQIYAATGVRGGLVVQLGCGDGDLTAALRAGSSFVVQGLDRDAGQVATIRTRLQALGVYGPVSVDRFDGRHLPYADNLVNLVVATDHQDVPMSEIDRVLVPGGVCYLCDRGQWTKTVKPWPDEIDEWTHFLHDASNNAVARDRRVGPPARMQWKVGPLWSRSHEHTSSIAAMISGGGRLFYVVDEGLTGITSINDKRIPDKWMLVGRDAFNGVQLWKRPLPQWRGDEWKNSALRARPASAPKRMVTNGQRLYATLSHRAGISVLDPASGETLAAIPETTGAQELVLVGKRLYAYVDSLAGRRSGTNGSIVAVDVQQNRPMWRTDVTKFLSQTLAADNRRIVCCAGGDLWCLSSDSGSELWRAAGSGGRGEKTVILAGKVVLEAGGRSIIARDCTNGKTLWTVPGGQVAMRPMDLFVTQGCAWHASASGITGYDLASGKPVKTLDPSAVQSAGHHLRCYRAKATERFLITQFRGAEFVSFGGEQDCNNDWIRGACRFGVVPANGLLYVPPNPCFCYPGAKLTGLLALAPEAQASDVPVPTAESPQLERGPAYGQIPSSSDERQDSSSRDWPTYRHDARRSGATSGGVPAEVSTRWQVRLSAPLTPPVVADGRIFVAAKDEHTLHVFGAADGKRQWQFIAGGRIDSPPTVYQGLVLFGCADGYVYCLRATDGQWVWRFRPATSERRIMAFNQLESAWRVHGSILVTGNVAYCTAGRSSFLDGGIRLVGLDPATGQVRYERRLDTRSPKRQDFQGQPFIPSYHLEGSISDILVAQDGFIYLTQFMFNRKLVPQQAPYVMPDPRHPVDALDITKAEYTISDPDMDQGFSHFRGFHRYMQTAHPGLTKEYQEKYGGLNMGDRRTGTHLAASSGFLDDSWFNRTYWMYAGVWPGWYHAHRGARSGQLLAVGPDRTYAVQAYPTRNRQSPLFTPGDKGYLLVVDGNDSEPVLDKMTRGATKGMGYTRVKPPVWFDWVPVRIRGMVLGGDRLFVAGPPDVISDDDPMASFEGRLGGVLRAYSAKDGKVLADLKLDSPPVFDGLIAAAGQLFLSTTDGHLVCLGQ